MFKEIKFRAYIKDDNKIYNVVNINGKFPDENFQRVFIGKDRGDGDPANYRMDGVDNIIMQHTGLKDSNGEDVYEDDVVRFIYSISKGYGKPEEEVITGVIQYNKHFHSEINANNGKQYHIDNLSKSIIIGNKYENPELLKND